VSQYLIFATSEPPRVLHDSAAAVCLQSACLGSGSRRVGLGFKDFRVCYSRITWTNILEVIPPFRQPRVGSLLTLVPLVISARESARMINDQLFARRGEAPLRSEILRETQPSTNNDLPGFCRKSLRPRADRTGRDSIALRSREQRTRCFF